MGEVDDPAVPLRSVDEPGLEDDDSAGFVKYVAHGLYRVAEAKWLAFLMVLNLD